MADDTDNTEPTIMAEKDGPLYIQNAKGLILLDSNGNPFQITDDEITLCRCGQSRNKPFCDDSHVRTGFQSEVIAPTLTTSVCWQEYPYKIGSQET